LDLSGKGGDPKSWKGPIKQKKPGRVEEGIPKTGKWEGRRKFEFGKPLSTGDKERLKPSKIFKESYFERKLEPTALDKRKRKK